MSANVADIYARQLEKALAENEVTGASFAYWDGKALHTANAGMRNSVTGDPVTADTVMHIGSITKVMNAVLLLQLVDEGRIALEDPVVEHLPELRLRDAEALKRITCGMLINHTSGINGVWLPEYGPDEERIVDAVHRCADLGQLFAPGEAISYCNIATVVAGYLTQKLRGESWYTLIKRRIYEPLGMQHALVDPLEVPRFRCSIGDVTDYKTGKFVQTMRPFLASSFAPAGSTQMTTAADLVTFARAMLNGGAGFSGARILSAAAAARMREPTASFFHPQGWQMGLGWKIMPGGVLHHGGGGRGVASLLYAHPKSGRVLALLTNSDSGVTLKGSILDPILESWTGITASPVFSQSANVPLDPKFYEGTYEDNLWRVEVFARDGGLASRQVPNGAQMGDLYDIEQSLEATLRPLGEHLFEQRYLTPGMSNIKQEIRFVQPDSSGRMRFLALPFSLRARAK
jgi:CubicO group peptidase (beta-lactamase class C family)